jgi:hypothetical protein
VLRQLDLPMPKIDLSSIPAAPMMPRRTNIASSPTGRG